MPVPDHLPYQSKGLPHCVAAVDPTDKSINIDHHLVINITH